MAVATTIFIFALAIFLSGAVLGVLVLLAVGIRMGSHGRHFPRAAHTLVEAVTRRLLGVGVRSHRDSTDEEG
jgi:hypothetical protein